MIVFNEQELKSIEDFEKEHLDCYRNPDALRKSTGFNIHQQWTGIGIKTTITCDCCGKTEDISDYSEW